MVRNEDEKELARKYNIVSILFLRQTQTYVIRRRKRSGAKVE